MLQGKRFSCCQLLLILSLSACGGGTSPGAEEPPKPRVSKWVQTMELPDTIGPAILQYDGLALQEETGKALFLRWPSTEIRPGHLSVVTNLAGSSWSEMPSVMPTIDDERVYFHDLELRPGPAGTLIASWRATAVNELDNGIWQVYANVFDGTNWLGPQQLFTRANATAQNITTAVAPDGSFWATWCESTHPDIFATNGEMSAVFAARFVPGEGWGVPQKVSGDLYSFLTPRITVDGNGTPHILFKQDMESLLVQRNVLSASHGLPAGEWSLPQELASHTFVPGESSGLGIANYQIAADDAGNVLTTWLAWDGIRDAVHSRRYMVGASEWEATAVLSLPSEDKGVAPSMALNQAGDGIVAWQEFDGDGFGIWVRRFEGSSGWQEPEIISSGVLEGESGYPRVAIDTHGTIFVVWNKATPAGPFTVYANRYTPENGWDEDEKISRPNTGLPSESRVSMYPDVKASNGQAIAIWLESDGGFYRWISSRYIP